MRTVSQPRSAIRSALPPGAPTWPPAARPALRSALGGPRAPVPFALEPSFKTFFSESSGDPRRSFLDTLPGLEELEQEHRTEDLRTPPSAQARRGRLRQRSFLRSRAPRPCVQPRTWGKAL